MRSCHSWETTGESYGSHSSRTLFGAHGYPRLKLHPQIKLEHRRTPWGQKKSWRWESRETHGQKASARPRGRLQKVLLASGSTSGLPGIFSPVLCYLLSSEIPPFPLSFSCAGAREEARSPCLYTVPLEPACFLPDLWLTAWTLCPKPSWISFWNFKVQLPLVQEP